MNTRFHSTEGYQALAIRRSTGAFARHHLKSEDRELAHEWERRLAPSGRVELVSARFHRCPTYRQDLSISDDTMRRATG